MKTRVKSKSEKLDTLEQSILDVLDCNKLKRPTSARQKEISDSAKATLNDLKSARINIRMHENDFQSIRLMADKAGMPYQTLITHIIHLYVTDQLISTKEVKKLVQAGVFDTRNVNDN